MKITCENGLIFAKMLVPEAYRLVRIVFVSIIFVSDNMKYALLVVIDRSITTGYGDWFEVPMDNGSMSMSQDTNAIIVEQLEGVFRNIL